MHEYRGSNTPARICYEDFQDWTNSHNLIHLPTKGARFTWANGRRGRGYTEKWLDRSVCNTLFIDAWSSISCNTLIKSESDHYPIMLHLHNNNNVRHASPFKFLRMWSKHDDCVNVVKQVWNSSIYGCPMFILSQKLKTLKSHLKNWNNNVFGNVHLKVEETATHLDLIQQHIDATGYNDILMEQERVAKLEYAKALHFEEDFWHEKARIKWHTDGDRNTQYFHQLAKV
ncbi:uncharacterized protein LOC123883120 [Trifolium pratense]|uniref:uncharacterized protein LOC123883120 n=1 Tax=Trifolium pratense TaxID=57577 RepID=UPI001E697502|nr:uncharacterized protein LOC123883120 [Trifolium pratense]